MKSKHYLLGANGMEELTDITLPMYCELKGYGAGMSDYRAAIFEDVNGTQKAVTLTDYETPHIFTVESYIRPLSKKFGIGIYYYDDLRTLTAEEIMPYVEQAREAERKRKEAAELARIEADKAKEIGKKLFEANMPKGATHVIIASMRRDESDGMTDYYGYSTERTIILAFSNHKRDIFSEMRKACLNCDIPEVREHATAPTVDSSGNERTEENKSYWSPKDEHREKYSMGAGHYLGASKYSGWVISKTSIEYCKEGHYTNAGREGGFFAFADKQPKQETARPDRVEVETGKVQIIDYSEKAIAVIGDTYPIKDKLKELGGRFNKFLSCGAGWIFPKTKLEELKSALSKKETALLTA